MLFGLFTFKEVQSWALTQDILIALLLIILIKLLAGRHDREKVFLASLINVISFISCHSRFSIHPNFIER